MKFASKVNRREHKIITTPLLSLDKFNRATLEEARKVIAGTSHWFAFDDDGNMKVLHPNDSPENQGPREAAKAKQVDVIRRPDFYRAELERMKNDGPSLSDYQKACLTELEELQNARAAIDPHGSEIIKTTNQMYDVHARLMAAEENKDQETQIKLTIELEKIDGRLEKLSKAPSHAFRTGHEHRARVAP
jgi:hypothetical protein